MTEFKRRIYWDGYGIGPKPSGVAVYASNLQRELSKLGVDPEIIGDGSQSVPFSSSKFWNLKPIHPFRTLAAAKKNIGDVGQSLPVVLHGLSNINIPYFRPNSKKIRTVITVHDLIPYFAQESVSRAYFLQFSLLLPKIVRNADKIICVSEWTKNTLLERFPEASSKCEVILNGSDAAFSGDGIQIPAKNQPNESGIVKILTVGRPEKYKRHSFFVDILRAAKGVIRGTIVTNQVGLKLISEYASDLIQKKILTVFVDVPNDKLSELYSKHDVYVHPSLYEGFCLPAAEALGAGIPVVFQSGSAIDEVVPLDCGVGMKSGDSAAAWVDAINQLSALKVTEKFLVALKNHHEKKATWKDAAVAVKKLYTYLLET